MHDTNMQHIKKELQGRVLERLDLTGSIEDEAIMDTIDALILATGKKSYLTLQQKHELRKEIFNAIRKYDVLQELIENDAITEIMINGPNHIFIEEDGRIRLWEKSFENEEKLSDIIQQIAARANRLINEANPIVDVRLEDGSRVNAVLKPVAIEGPVVTIRKFPNQPITIEKLIELNSLSKEAAGFLEKLVKAKYNIFISGGTGSGKTTFLNALSNFIPSDERIITIEDSAELQIQGIPNLVRLEVKNANVEGKNAVTIRDLIKTSLRMRPDRIIVGEVRDSAAIDMIAALNTGHDGSLSTGHANSPADMLSRLESLVLMGMEIPLPAVRRQLASALDIIVHLGRLRDKSRRTLEIDEVLEVEDEKIQVKPLYVFREEGETKDGRVLGGLQPTGAELTQTVKLERAGISL